MRAIYEPVGRAREYAELACNLYDGCVHGCRYCYVPGILRKKREEFHAHAKPRPDILAALERDCKRMRQAGDKRRVLFCFACDPYPPISVATRAALRICEEHEIPFSVLTKGGTRAARDFDLMARTGGWFGQTIIFPNWGTSFRWETSRTASVPDRYTAARLAHHSGIFTWVSIEPVIDPAGALRVIEELAEHVDLWRVGKWNHDARANEIDWGRFASEVHAALKDTRASYLIKKDLAEYLPAGVDAEYWKAGEALA